MITNLRQSDFVLPNNIFSDLSEGKAIKAFVRSKAGITWLLSGFDTTEESLKRPIDALQRMLQCRRVHFSNIRSVWLDLRELKILIKPGDVLPFKPPRVTTLLQRRIVKLTTHSEMASKNLLLLLGWINTESKTANHGGILP